MDGIAIKYNDDGEPSGTAGSPILKMVLEQGLSNVLVVVTRYFGGILLGTGGLVRAYTDATKNALEKVEILNKVLGNKLDIVVEYEELEKFKYYAEKRNFKIINTQYLDKVVVNIEIDNEKLEELTNNNNIKDFNIIEIKNIRKKFIEI